MSPSPNASPEEARRADFEAKVAAAIDAYGLLGEKDRILVAVSAGPDSVALLHALIALKRRYPIALAVAHLNHGLREAAAAEQAFVADLANHLELPFHTTLGDVRARQRNQGLSLEDAARRVRYAFLEQTADAHGYTKIAVGHQADDTAELVLMNLLRGSGLQGLAGIAPRRGRVIRPLSDIYREEILAYLKAGRQPYLLDESNVDPAFTRNRIRHELIPHLASAYNPNLLRTLHRTARILRDEDAWMEAHLDTVWDRLRPKAGETAMRIGRKAFVEFPPALQRRILRRGLARIADDLKRIGLDHIEGIRRLAEATQAGPKHLDLPKGLRVRVDDRDLTIHRESAEERRKRRQRGDRQGIASNGVYAHWIACPPETPLTIEVPEIQARLRLWTAAAGTDVAMPEAPWKACFDLDHLRFPLELRPIRPGDRLRPLGMRGSKKVSDLLSDAKVPPATRRRTPVLVSAGGVVWVAGVRIAHNARVRADTQRLLMGEFCLLK